MRRTLLIACAVWLAWPVHTSAGTPATRPDAGRVPAAAVDLQPTAHSPLPADAEKYWFVPPDHWRPPAPAAVRTAIDRLKRAAALVAEDKAAAALPLITPRALEGTPLHPYAIYLRGLAELNAGQQAAARKTFAAVPSARPTPALAERAALGEADAAEALNDRAGALAVYERIGTPVVIPGADLLLRTARAAAAVGDTARARQAWERLYFEFPSTDAGATAAAQLASAPRDPLAPGNARFAAELARAERLFTDRRFSLARDGFALLLPHTTGDQRELVSLRIAACDYSMRRYRAAIDRLRPFLDSASRRAEARFFHLSAVRGLGDHGTYQALVRQLVTEFPDSSWAEDALNNLASHHLISNEDQRADEVFREILARYPASRHAPRAAWRAGWWAYKHGRHAEAADIFERAAAAFPRSDYRPSWLYWAGRARERTGPAALAIDRHRLVEADYANSYYGRLAAARLKLLKAPPAAADRSLARWHAASTDPALPAPTADLLAWLIHAGLYSSALDEVTHAQRTLGRSAPLDATRAWLLNRTGSLRAGINLMRATYPHFMAAGGEQLPLAIQQVIFPLDHWPLLSRYATANGLDPYFVAALVAQESSFDPNARSSANAIGLMQIMPATGRRWAAKLGIRPYSTARLTNPTTNVRIGTAYFADLVKRFGGVPYALAGYNAGDSRVARWLAERPGLPREEFIDDIPFPETQNYVRRIMGTADDYRRLYSGTHPAVTAPAPDPPSDVPAPVIITPRR